MKYQKKTAAQGYNPDTNYVGQVWYNKDAATPCIPPGWMPTRNLAVPVEKIYRRRANSPSYPWIPSPEWPEGPLGYTMKSTRVRKDDVAKAEQMIASSKGQVEVAHRERDAALAQAALESELAQYLATETGSTMETAQAKLAELRKRQGKRGVLAPSGDVTDMDWTKVAHETAAASGAQQ